MPTTTAAPRLVWQGAAAWLDVAHSSSLGDGVHTLVGPVPGSLITPALAAAVIDRVKAMVDHASADAGVVIQQNAQLCSRCIRTILRMALGSRVDAQAIANPTKDGDAQRYANASQVLAPYVARIQADLQELNQEAATGSVRDSMDVTLQVPSGNNPHADLYERAGAPMHVGQWTDYKLCACGDPTDRTSLPQMIVGALPSQSEVDKPRAASVSAADAVAAAMGYR
jgi:hypothetical protein